MTDLVSVSACGSLKEDLPPGHFVLVDQFIDRTFAREKSFFGTGCVAHVSLADPVGPALVDAIEQAARAEGIPYDARRHLSGHGGPAVFDARGVATSIAAGAAPSSA